MGIFERHGSVSAEEFERRLVALARGMDAALPRRQRDRHILFRSVAQTLDAAVSYSEQTLNEVLKEWVSGVGQSDTLDHVTLRRHMIDARYLDRNPEGSSYRVSPDGSGDVTFEPGVGDIDSVSVVQAARERAAARRRERNPGFHQPKRPPG